MSSLPQISSATARCQAFEQNTSVRTPGGSTVLETVDASRFVHRYLEELSDALGSVRPRSQSLQAYPTAPGMLRVIERNQIADSLVGRVWQAELRALRSGDVDRFHVDDVHVVLPIAGTIVTAGKDGRAIASSIQGESIVAQPIHPTRASPILFHGEEDAMHRPAVSEDAWVTSGAAHGRHFALGRRDGTIFRGEIADERGGRVIHRRWRYAGGAGKPGNWEVRPETPRIQERQGQRTEDVNSRRVFGLALLQGAEGAPPALTAACGSALWTTSSYGGKPSVTPLTGLLSGMDPELPERILGLQGLSPRENNSPSSLFVLGQEYALWLTATGSHNPLEIRLGAGLELDLRHVSAHWIADEGGAQGALGQAHTGNITVVEWAPDGSAHSEEWQGGAEEGRGGTAWSIDHLSSDLIVSGHQDSLVRLWDVRTGSAELDIHLPFGRASGMAVDPEPKQVIACVADNQCRTEGHGGTSMAVWDLRKSSKPLAQTAASPSEEDLFKWEA